MVRATVAAIGLALALAPAAFATHNEPLRGQWSFEDPQCVDAPCYVADSSGHALTGVDYGSTQTVPGRWGSAVQQPNKSSYIDVGSQPLLQPATMTVVAWVRAASTPGLIQYAVSQGANGGCSYSSYAIYTGAVMPGLRFYVATGSGLFFSPAADNTMWDGAWHMTAGTYDGSAVRFYVDGHEVGSGTPASGSINYGLAVNNNFTIGNFADPPECAENTNFPGDVDEVRVYSRALTATEIGRMADPAATSPPDLVPDGGLGPPPTPPAGGDAPVAAYTELGISHQLLGAVTVSAQASVASTGADRITGYHWAITGPDKPLNVDCGDGATTMSHPFRKPGDYLLTLTVTDTLDHKATTTAPVSVGTDEIVPKLKDPFIFACLDPPEGQQASTNGCVKSFGFGIVDVNSRGRPSDCFDIVPRINPGILTDNSTTKSRAGGEQVSQALLQVYHATIGGPVAINGILLKIPESIKSEYDSWFATIGLKGLDSIKLEIPPLLSKEVPLNLKVTPDKKGVFHVFDVDQAIPKLIGALPTRGALSIDLIKHASKIKVGLGLPSIFSFQGNKTAQGDAYLLADNATGLHLDGVGLRIPEVFVGPIYVKDLSFKYIKSENLWDGGAKVTLPGSPISLDASQPPPDFGFGLKNGKFDHAGFGVVFEPPARPDLFPPFHSVLLTHIGAALGLNPLRLTGTIGLSSAEVVDEDGVLFGAFASSTDPYEFPSDVGEQLAPLAGKTLDSFSLAVGGTASLHVPVLGVLPLLNSYGLYRYPDYFEFGGGFSFGISFLKIDGGVNGFVFASQKKFNLEGGLSACLRNIEVGFKFVSVKVSPCLNVGGVISSKGVGFCGVVPIPFPVFGTISVPLGAGYHWGDSTPDLMPFSCDYAPYREVSPKARAADTTRTVDLPAGLPAAMFRIQGDGGAPSVTITDPKGADAGGSEDTIVLGGTEDNTTLVALRKPAAGRWTVTTKDGSPPITAVASRNALPKLAIRANVRRHGRRRVLAYRIANAAGRTITFAERGPRTARILGVAHGRSGSIAFTPAAGSAGKRTIIAMVEDRSGPARPASVASYTAPAARRLARPARVRASRHRGKIRVTWKRVGGVSRYEVLVALADGSKVFRTTRRTRITLADPFARMRGKLSVDALAADGSRGRASTIRLRGSPRR